MPLWLLSRTLIVAERHFDGRVTALFTVDSERDARDLAEALRNRGDRVVAVPSQPQHATRR
jgi:hypothetical protein